MPLRPGDYGVGQVVDDISGELYIVVYDMRVASTTIGPDIVLDKVPLFGALSLDGKFWNGHWPTVGNEQRNLKDIRQPVYKVGYKNTVYLESRDRSVFREATQDEIAKLGLRSVVAPVRLENALKAYYGIVPWDSKFDQLRYEYSLLSSMLL